MLLLMLEEQDDQSRDKGKRSISCAEDDEEVARGRASYFRHRFTNLRRLIDIVKERESCLWKVAQRMLIAEDCATDAVVQRKKKEGRLASQRKEKHAFETFYLRM